MGTSIKTIEVKKINCDDNRKYTKDEGFDQLVESIKAYGIIEPPLIRKQKDGNYNIVAGRRRIAAFKKIFTGKGEIECKVYDEDNPLIDDEVALAENVNRQAMHPLDEAALFFKMECRGLSAKEIAKLYARSPQDIYKRLRLMRLTDDLKKAFRDGWMDIEAAAIIAELPEEDQNDFYTDLKEDWEDFYTEFEDDDENYKAEIDNYVRKGIQAARFVQERQKYIIKPLMKGCADCKKRTHNTDNDLFNDYASWGDVCLDAECYRVKWKNMVEKALDDYIKENRQYETDRMIFFANGVPADIYKQAKHVLFNLDSLKEPDAKFEVVKQTKYDFTVIETNRKKDCCYRIREHGDGQITVERVGYKLKERAKADPDEKKKNGSKAEAIMRTPEDKYGGKEVNEAVAEELGITAREAAEQLIKNLKPKNGYDNSEDKFKKEIEELIRSRIIKKKLESPRTQDYFLLFLKVADAELIGVWADKYLKADDKELLKSVTGKDSLTSLSEFLNEDGQTLFHYLFLKLEDCRYDDLPDLEELNKLKPGDNLFFDYSGLTKEEYAALYIEVAKEITVKHLGKPKPKAQLVKKPGKKKKAAADDGVQRCRVCGCTEVTPCINEHGESCFWVEEDLCSACASEEELEAVYEAADETDPDMGTDDEDYDEDPAF